MTKLWNPWKLVVTCYPDRMISSRGIWVGDNPIKFSTPVFIVQAALSAFVIGTIDFFLRPYGICSFFSHLVGTIILGPTTMFGNSFQEFLLSNQSLHILETLKYLGEILFLFVVGLKMDFRMATASGRNAILIGISIGLSPMLVTAFAAKISQQFLPIDSKVNVMLFAVAMTEGQISFHVVACLLADLNILNSEIGRLAIASSMIANLCGAALMTMIVGILEVIREGKLQGFLKVASVISLFLGTLYLVKPIMNWMIKQIPSGTNKMKEVHVLMIFLMVFVSAYVGQILGHPPGFGPLLLGLAVPPGPPLAETIEDKLEAIISVVFLPLFYLSSSVKFSAITISLRHVICVLLIVILAFLTKMIGTIIPSMYSGISVNDSIVLGLINASQGLVHLVYYNDALLKLQFCTEIYTLLVYSAVVIAGVTSVLIKVMHKPSMDYLAYKRRTLGDSMHNSEFRVLACIYRDFDIPSIISILGASNATEKSPICLYLLHLIELQRIAPPFLISHKRNDDSSIYYNRSEHIINAFRMFEQQYDERIFSLYSFSALSPSATMHQDICSLAANTRVSLVILPFHRQLDSDGIMESKATIRNVNSSVLKLSPCTVGILIDRRRVGASTSIASQSKSLFHIVLIFLGGADDREVLTYGMHMVEGPNTILTLIRFSVMGDMINSNPKMEKKLDAELLDVFSRKYIGRERVNYREEVVSGAFEIVKVVTEFEGRFDLIMVGRQHGKESELFSGLVEWNEYPELGLMGDLLATSRLLDDVSILVLQQKFQNSDDLDDNALVHGSKYIVRD
ncbi:hypothetical protein ACHQM5_026951 [Ranunculus cassubicifolius]